MEVLGMMNGFLLFNLRAKLELSLFGEFVSSE